MTVAAPRGGLIDEIARLIVKGLSLLPTSIKAFLAGPPTVIQNYTLYSEVGLVLRIMRALPENDLTALPVPAARARLDKEAATFAGRPHVANVENIEITTRAGTRPARVYVNYRDEPLATMVYYHGGGWVLGSLNSTDDICRFIAANSAIRVVSIDYRLAPEHKFPAAVDDCIDAYEWCRAEWPGLVAVGGDSAGGNLSAVVAQQAKIKPDYALMLNPATDFSVDRPSVDLFAEGFFLTKKNLRWYRHRYLRNDDDATDPRASPLLGKFDDHPPTHVVVSGFDPLRDEGIAYADKLREKGIDVSYQLVEGHIHAFANCTGVSREAKRAMTECVKAVVAGLERVKAAR